VVAGRIQEEHPEWSDEEVFQRARRVVVATLQVRLNLRKMELFKAFVVIYFYFCIICRTLSCTNIYRP
jgi:hypothetical protein